MSRRPGNGDCRTGTAGADPQWPVHVCRTRLSGTVIARAIAENGARRARSGAARSQNAPAAGVASRGMRRLSLPRSGGERDTKGLAVSLGKNIKRLRTMVGLRTQKAFAELLGLPQSQVSDWENNRYALWPSGGAGGRLADWTSESVTVSNNNDAGIVCWRPTEASRQGANLSLSFS